MRENGEVRIVEHANNLGNRNRSIFLSQCLADEGRAGTFSPAGMGVVGVGRIRGISNHK